MYLYDKIFIEYVEIVVTEGNSRIRNIEGHSNKYLIIISSWEGWQNILYLPEDSEWHQKLIILYWFFPGSQGRPDSRGPAFEVNEPPPTQVPQHLPSRDSNPGPQLKASLGPVISNGLSVAPRIRQLQMQIANNPPSNNPTCAPRGSLV